MDSTDGSIERNIKKIIAKQLIATSFVNDVHICRSLEEIVRHESVFLLSQWLPCLLPTKVVL